MIFSKATEYAIRALAFMANQPEGTLCGLREIAEHEHIPPVFLRKVLGELRRHRMLASVKGIHGGYKFAKSPKTITMWDVFRLLEPDSDLDVCVLGGGLCSAEKACPLHSDWQSLRQAFVELLQSKSIYQIAVAARSCGSSQSPNQLA